MLKLSSIFIPLTSQISQVSPTFIVTRMIYIIINYIRIFYGHNDSAIHHVIDFIRLLATFNIVHEDNMMQMFASTLAEKAYCWFSEDLPNKHITSLSKFLDMFLKQWCRKGSCMVAVERNLKNSFSNMLPKIDYHEEIQEPPRLIMVDNIECFEFPLKNLNKEEIKHLLEHSGTIPRTHLDAKKEIHKNPLIEDIIKIYLIMQLNI